MKKMLCHLVASCVALAFVSAAAAAASPAPLPQAVELLPATDHASIAPTYGNDSAAVVIESVDSDAVLITMTDSATRLSRPPAEERDESACQVYKTSSGDPIADIGIVQRE